MAGRATRWCIYLRDGAQPAHSHATCEPQPQWGAGGGGTAGGQKERKCRIAGGNKCNARNPRHKCYTYIDRKYNVRIAINKTYKEAGRGVSPATWKAQAKRCAVKGQATNAKILANSDKICQ